MIAIKIDDEHMGLQKSFAFKDFIQQELTGAKWIKDQKIWQVEFSIENIEKLRAIRCNIPNDIMEEYEKRKSLMKQVTNEKFVDKTEPIEEMPIKAKPYQHQVKAFNIACKLMKLFKGE